jgi:hypothetical protein
MRNEPPNPTGGKEMSLDDQLLKPDGTLITAIDIWLLRLARFIARFFVRKDEETFDQATKRLYRLSGHMFLICLGGCMLDSNILMLFICLKLNTEAYEFSHLSTTSKLRGLGTNIPISGKYKALSLITFGPLFAATLCLTLSFLSPIRLLQSLLPTILTGAIFGLTVGSVIFIMIYVERLGKVPPKKVKAKAKVKAKQPKLAFAPQ